VGVDKLVLCRQQSNAPTQSTGVGLFVCAVSVLWGRGPLPFRHLLVEKGWGGVGGPTRIRVAA